MSYAIQGHFCVKKSSKKSTNKFGGKEKSRTFAIPIEKTTIETQQVH